MRAVDIIIKKRDHQELSQEELEFFVNGFTRGEIPDYQVAAWAMAVLLNGMTPVETTNLTMAMAHTGEILDLSPVVPLAVDKHSTGGVGDKTTLVVEPLVAACGQPIGKMSGRGLGFSGGTLDKMESIPGFRANLTKEEFLAQLGSIGIVLSGQSVDMAPADGLLYALRDVTGTVQSIPLIASSVMSKKIAAGAQAIVLDVKVGMGAFMRNLNDATELSHLMVSIGKLCNRKVVALLSDMNQPLGCAVGNAVEVREAIDTLKGSGPADFSEHCIVVASHLLKLAGKAEDLAAARAAVQTVIANGRALACFRELVSTQGGDVRYIDNPDLLPGASLLQEVKAERDGYLSEINARIVGESAVVLGAGRAKKGDPIDHGVGILVDAKVGDRVSKGQTVFRILANKPEAIEPVQGNLLAALKYSDKTVEPLPLFYGVVAD